MDDISRDGLARTEYFKSGARSFVERIETLRALGSSQRFAVFIENDYLPLTDQKAPFAADAIV
jgi:hypothetical protein